MNADEESIDIPVLIVGAGPVGMSAAVLLDRFGIPSVVIERSQDRGTHPKARGIRLRTMELLRQWGLEPELREQSLPAEAMRFIYCESLTGEEIARSPKVVEDDSQSPTTLLRVAQDALERGLLDHVRSRPAIDLRLGTEAVGLHQDADAVTATATSGLHSQRIRARYAIAADGVGSGVRRVLGIELDGPPLLGWWQSIYWTGDISAFVADRQCIQFFTGVRGGSPATVASVDGRDRWITLVTRQDQTRPELPSITEAVELVRRAVGANVDLEVLDTTTWRLSAQVARRFGDERIFLVGDAAHALPPTGGFGLNTGVQDAHNLMWKLAAVLHGWAHPSLLATYERERHPVAQENADWSLENSKRFLEIRRAIAAGDRGGLKAALEDQKRHISARDRDLGFHYRQGALVPDGTAEPTGPPGVYIPSARPGHRAPHFWLRRNAERISSLDLFDLSFVLLVSDQGSAWIEAARELAANGLPLEIHRVGRELEDEAHQFEGLYEVEPDGAVLVRPDGHVAFRSATASRDPRRTLIDVCEQLHLRRIGVAA